MGYEDHARRLHAQATEAHQDWVASLSPKQKRKLRSLGVLEASDDSKEVNGHGPAETGDIAESPRARTEWDPAQDLDRITETLADYFEIPINVAEKVLQWHQEMVRQALGEREGELLSIVIGGLISAKNVRVATAGLAFAADLAGANGYSSQSDFASKHGISRQAISKSTKAWSRDLGLQTSAHQKSERACQTYSQLGKTNHWRNQKTNAVELLRKLKKKSTP